MKKLILFLSLLFVFFSFSNVNASSIIAEKDGNDISFTIDLDLSDDVNALSGTFNYDNNILSIKSIYPLGDWSNLEYNSDTNEFIVVRKKFENNTTNIIKINARLKNGNYSRFSINNISYSEGKNLTRLPNINYDYNSKEINNNSDVNSSIDNGIYTYSGENNNTSTYTYSDNKDNKKSSKSNNDNAGTLNKYNSKSDIFSEDSFILIYLIITVSLLILFVILVFYKRNKVNIFITFILSLLIIFFAYKVVAVDDYIILEKYLVHLDKKIDKKFDVNDDGYINIVDLSIILKDGINKNSNTSTKIDNNDNKESKNDDTPTIINYRDTTSIYAWGDNTLVYGDSANDVYKNLSTLKVDTIYQSFNKYKMTKEFLGPIISGYNSHGIKLYRLIGDPSWAYDNVSDAKNKIDEINNYNNSVSGSEKIVGVTLDVEPHAYYLWKRNTSSQQKYFSKYVDNMVEYYNYAKKYNLDVTISIPVWYDKFDDFDKLFQYASDTYSLMNYSKKNNIRRIKEEISAARKYDKKVENTFNVLDNNRNESENYRPDGINKLLSDQKDILDTYNYKYLRSSFHQYRTIVDILGG